MNEPADGRVQDGRHDGADLLGTDVCLVKGDQRRLQAPGRGAKLVDVARLGYRPTDDERRTSLGRQQVHVRDDADQLAAVGTDGQVAHAAVDHGEHQLGARTVGVGRHRRGAHHPADRLVERQPLGDDADAQIVIGDDPQLARPEPHKGAARPLLGHALRRFAYRRVGGADHEPLVDERPGGQVSDDAVAPHDRLARARAFHQRTGNESKPCRAGEQRHDVLRREAVAEGVLGGTRGPAGRQSGQHRRVSEPLALHEQIQHTCPVHQLDAPPADDAHVPELRLSLAEDHVPRPEQLNLGPCREPLQRGLLEPREGLVRA